MRTEESIKQIIAGGETVRVEFKSCTDKVSGSVYETVCSFLNHNGGIILLGVNDDGAIEGINPANAVNMSKSIINASNNPELFVPSANVHPELMIVDGKTIMIIELEPSESASQYKHKFYDRNGDADVDVTKQRQLLQAIFERKSSHLFESRIVEGLSLEDLDGETFKMCRNLLSTKEDGHPWLSMSDKDLLESCQLIRKQGDGAEQLTYASLLLFGTEECIFRFWPQYRIEAIFRQYTFEAYEAGTTDDVRYDDRMTLRCNLLQAYRQLLQFVQRHLPDKFYLPEGSVSREDLRVLLFREIIINMLVHADYSIGYADFLEIYTDRVVTRNHTRLVSTAHEDTIGIDQLENYTKNPLIAKVFREMGWMEDLGTGTVKIKKYAPLYYKDYQIAIKDAENFVFSITYSPTPAFMEQHKSEEAFPSPIHALVYALLRQVPGITTKEMTDYIKVSQRTIFNILDDLKRGGWIEREGAKNKSRWKILK